MVVYALLMLMMCEIYLSPYLYINGNVNMLVSLLGALPHLPMICMPNIHVYIKLRMLCHHHCSYPHDVCSYCQSIDHDVNSYPCYDVCDGSYAQYK